MMKIIFAIAGVNKQYEKNLLLSNHFSVTGKPYWPCPNNIRYSWELAYFPTKQGQVLVLMDHPVPISSCNHSEGYEIEDKIYC